MLYMIYIILKVYIILKMIYNKSFSKYRVSYKYHYEIHIGHRSHGVILYDLHYIKSIYYIKNNI